MNSKDRKKVWIIGLLVMSVFLSYTSVPSSKGASNDEDIRVVSGTAVNELEPTVGPAPATPEPTASIPPSGSATLRLIYTTDIHGQVNNYDYQRMKSTTNGLNRLYTMIKTARSEAGESNYMTFDVGDSIMDYTTNYIYNSNQAAIQPVYKAMSKMGYDAITLGNHEFDYGYDYLMTQLIGSNLLNKVVLSNVTARYATDKPYIFGKENRIFNKKVIDDNGVEHVVKVGVFGVTPPSMSTRTEKISNILKSEGIVTSAKKEVEKLKAAGADIIVALAHSGFGAQEPGERDANVDYALSKIDGLDVILGGHQHVYYPTGNRKDVYYSLPGVDVNSGLVNGKRVLILRDSARAIGLADLRIYFNSEGQARITGSSAEIRKANDSIDTDDTITDTMNTWNKKLKTYGSKQIGSIGDQRWTSYLAPLEDNEIIQTVQNAQMYFAYNQISSNATKYINYPIICATRYGQFGRDSSSEFGDVTGMLTYGKVSNFARYHQYIYLYEITGAQLKEWLEWAAQIYQTTGRSREVNWDNLTLDKYVRGAGESLLSNENINEWFRMFRFGGIEYTVDPSKPARYNADGKKVNNNERIISLTRNGEPITADQKFVIACDQILGSMNNEATQGVSKQKILGTHMILQDVVNDYLCSVAALGSKIHIDVSNNWKLKLTPGYRFGLITSESADETIRTSKWYDNGIDVQDGYAYYQCRVPEEGDGTDREAPNVVLAPSETESTNKSVKIGVMANDISGIAQIKYCAGNHPVGDSKWIDTLATDVYSVTNNNFTVSKSGMYSVYVVDNAGNAIVQRIAVLNVNPSALKNPTINKVDNNDKKIKGNAQVGTTINIIIGNKHYKSKVSVDGTYSVKISPTKSGSKVTAYVNDGNGHKSGNVTTKIKRVGPNCPTIDKVRNNSQTIKGKTNDTDSRMYMIIGKKVYVSSSLGANYYKKCKKYKKSYSIKKTPIKVSKDGTYSISVPHLKPGTKVQVFGVDRVGRVSAGYSKVSEKISPEPVRIASRYEWERHLYGVVPGGKKAVVSIYVNGSKSAIKGTTDADGNFAIELHQKLKKGMKVVAKARFAGKNAMSYPHSETVGQLANLSTDANGLSVKNITTNDKEVTGTTRGKNVRVVLLLNEYCKSVKSGKDGKFTIKLKKKLKEGTEAYILIRSKKGSISAARHRVVKKAEKKKDDKKDKDKKDNKKK